MLNSIVSSARLRNPTKRQKSLPFACIVRSSPSSETNVFLLLSYVCGRVLFEFILNILFFFWFVLCARACVWKMDFGFFLKNGFNNFDHVWQDLCCLGC